MHGIHDNRKCVHFLLYLEVTAQKPQGSEQLPLHTKYPAEHPPRKELPFIITCGCDPVKDVTVGVRGVVGGGADGEAGHGLARAGPAL